MIEAALNMETPETDAEASMTQELVESIRESWPLELLQQ